uniref:Uncharacterized protein n=1 Tax=Onchocerca volvulus TaxID=6282 RepID=A0A8R1XNS6_ONCVO
MDKEFLTEKYRIMMMIMGIPYRYHCHDTLTNVISESLIVKKEKKKKKKEKRKGVSENFDTSFIPLHHNFSLKKKNKRFQKETYYKLIIDKIDYFKNEMLLLRKRCKKVNIAKIDCFAIEKLMCAKMYHLIITALSVICINSVVSIKCYHGVSKEYYHSSVSFEIETCQAGNFCIKYHRVDSRKRQSFTIKSCDINNICSEEGCTIGSIASKFMGYLRGPLPLILSIY